MRKLLVRLCCLLVALFGACADGTGLMPNSGGRPYEVLVVGADAAAVGMVAEGLRAQVMEALPQQEPLFSVSAVVSEGLSQATRYARNLVVVTTGDSLLRRPRISYEQNVYARRQLVLHVRAANADQLRTSILYNVRALSRQLVLQELNNGIQLLREKHNVQAVTMAKDLFGVRLWVPEDLTRWKRGKDFLWISNDAATGMQNICVYRYQGTHLTKEEAVRKRDSVMQCNLPGEDEGCYMTTVAGSVIVDQYAGRNRDDKAGILASMKLRGLWEMQGDAMGGPFVSLSTRKGDSVLVVEAFVYAPEKEKRSLVHRLEASLHTLRIEN